MYIHPCSKKIEQYLSQLDYEDKVYVDIGSSYETNLPNHFIKEGDKTIFIEADTSKAAQWTETPNFKILNERATPDNIESLLKTEVGNKDIAYLDIDIDGYDYHVLDALLKYKKPYMFIAEINEKIPPPIKFSVKYTPEYSWDTSHFYGMSISQAFILVEKYGYDLLELSINNIICIRKDKNFTGISLSAEEAYDQGYKNPRLQGQISEFHWNANMDFLLHLSPQEALAQIDKIFLPYKGKYECTSNK
jgi:hypothetical protein